MTTRKNRVLVIGWDAADWRIIKPLMQRGEMPNLSGMIANGVSGNLRTLTPAASPMLWTSIATGKRPYKHGVLGFTEPDPAAPGKVRPVSSCTRQTRAIWNILNLEGKTSHVVGWWPSDPPEPIRGSMVSNLFMQEQTLGNDRSGSVHPPELYDQLRDVMLQPHQIREEVVHSFIPQYHRLDGQDLKLFNHLRRTIAEASNAQTIITSLMQQKEWDFAAVYLDAIDHMCHAFMDFHPPKVDWVSEQDFELYRGVIDATYQFHDLMLGYLLHLAGPETTVILLSDHGFESGSLRTGKIPLTGVGPVSQHRENGIIVMQGPGIRHHQTLHGASLLDITPTILQVMGLPVGDDMDGVPLVNAFREPQDVRRIPTWEDIDGDDGGLGDDHVSVSAEESLQSLDRLVALGYVEKPEDGELDAVLNCQRESEFFLAQSLMDGGKLESALSVLQKLVARWPEEIRFGAHLIKVLQVLGRLEEASVATDSLVVTYRAVRDAAREKLRDPVAAGLPLKADGSFDPGSRAARRTMLQAVGSDSTIYLLLSSQAEAEGHAETALKYLDLAEKHGYEKTNRHFRRAQILCSVGRWEEAIPEYRIVLKHDPEQVSALHGLSQCNLALRNYTLALSYAMDSVSLAFTSARSHYLLGLCLQRTRKWTESAEAMRMAVIMNPGYVPALRALIRIADKRLQDAEMSEKYRKQLRSLLTGARGVSATDATSLDLPESQRTAGAVEDDCGSELVERDFGQPVQLEGRLQDSVVVVTGLPRTGTSMMMQMLRSGGLEILDDKGRTADVSNERGYCEDRRATRLHRDASWLTTARGQAVKIVAQLLPFLKQDPDLKYRVIFMDRDLKEVLRSQQEMLKQSSHQTDVADEEKLVKAYRSQLKSVRRILRERGIPTLHVSYRDCLQDAAAVAAKVSDFLGGDLNVDAMANAVDAKLCHQTTL